MASKSKKRKSIYKKRRNLSFNFHKKVKKWTTKVIMIDIFLSIFFFCCVIHWIIEVFHSFKKWSSLLLSWLLFLLVIEILLFAESIKVLYKNLIIYMESKKKNKLFNKDSNLKIIHQKSKFSTNNSTIKYNNLSIRQYIIKYIFWNI